MRGARPGMYYKRVIPLQEAQALRMRFLVMLGNLNTTVVAAAKDLGVSKTILHALTGEERSTYELRDKLEAWLAKHEGVAA